ATRAAPEIRVIETGNAPTANHALRRRQRCPGVDDGGSAIDLRERQGHRALGGEKAAAVRVEPVRHLQLPSRELGVREPRALLQDEDAMARQYEGAERLCHRAATGA